MPAEGCLQPSMEAAGDVLAARDASLAQDRARILYAYGVSGVLVAMLASAFLVLMVGVGHASQWAQLAWLGGMMIVLSVRLVDIMVLHRRRTARPFDGHAEMLRFAAGALIVGLLWGLFSVLFFPLIGMAGRAAAAVVLAGMAGGATTVLAPCLWLVMAYCTELLAPASVMMVLAPGRESSFLAALGVAMLVSMLICARIAHASCVGALRLGRDNEALLARAETMNSELKNAQTALYDANLSLEDRIEARTADLAREIAERKRYAEALARLASTDPLTGLHNRNTFVERLACMLADADARGAGLAVLFLDLDNFKQVNDVRGHAVGDAVLQQAAHLFRATGGEGVEIARWGGDEFVVAMVTATGAAPALKLADDLRRSLTATLPAGLDSLNLDLTIGVSVFPEDGRTQDALIRAADVAMYEAKKEGKGRTKLFDPALASGIVERHALEQALHNAIGNNELSIVFQPIVCARTNACEALEALLRWTHPERGAVGPGIFIPIAEQTGQIFALGRWVLYEACRIAASWRGWDTPITVNVSVAQFLSGTLLDDIAGALAASGLPATRLQIEITESMFVSDHVRVTPVFDALRAQGIRILLDDFGTGFSSLAYLGKLPIDVIKIDQSFVRAAETDGYAVISAILSIAAALRLQVTAEGVETMAQRTRLAALGVERLQGYLISRPMPQAEVTGWLRHRQRQPPRGQQQGCPAPSGGRVIMLEQTGA